MQSQQFSAEKKTSKMASAIQLNGIALSQQQLLQMQPQRKTAHSFVYNLQNTSGPNGQQNLHQYQSSQIIPSMAVVSSSIMQQDIQPTIIEEHFDSAQSKQKRLANDKLFLKNISLRNVRQIYNPAAGASMTTGQKLSGASSFVQQSATGTSALHNRTNFQSIDQQPQMQRINPNDPFDLQKHRNETVTQMINHTKKKHPTQILHKSKKSDTQSPIKALCNPQGRYQTQAEKISKRDKNYTTLYGAGLPVGLTGGAPSGLTASNVLRQTHLSFVNCLPPSSSLMSPLRQSTDLSKQNQSQGTTGFQKSSSHKTIINNSNVSHQLQMMGPPLQQQQLQQSPHYQQQLNPQLYTTASNAFNIHSLVKQNLHQAQQQQQAHSSDRNKKKKTISLDNLEKLYSNLRMRADSSDRLTLNSKGAADRLSEDHLGGFRSSSTTKNKSNALSNQSNQRGGAPSGQRKKKEEKKKLVQNIQNNINLSFNNTGSPSAAAAASTFHDPSNHFKILELDMIKRLESIEDPINIYLDTMNSIAKTVPITSDIIHKVMVGLKELSQKQKQNHRNDLNQYQKVIEDLQEQLTLEQAKVATLNLEVSQFRKKVQLTEQNVHKKDQLIEGLQEKLEEMTKQQRQFLGKYDEGKILEEIKILVNENQELKSAVREVKSEMDYGKQRENKLMYFLFVLQKKGIPIYDIFDQNIKDLPTARFSQELDDQYKTLYYEQQKRLKMKGHKILSQSLTAKRIKAFEKEMNDVCDSLNTTESYFPICSGPLIKPNKPDVIPVLDLKKVEVVQAERMKLQQQQDRLKQMQLEKKSKNLNGGENQSELDDEAEDYQDEEDDGFSLGFRSTTRIQDLIRKTKYEPLEGVLLASKLGRRQLKKLIEENEETVTLNDDETESHLQPNAHMNDPYQQNPHVLYQDQAELLNHHHNQPKFKPQSNTKQELFAANQMQGRLQQQHPQKPAEMKQVSQQQQKQPNKNKLRQ